MRFLAGLLVALAWLSPSPAAEPVGKDEAGDPLPKGARFRIGNAHLVHTGLSSGFPRPFMLFPPDGKTFVLFKDTGAFERFDVVTGAPLGKLVGEEKKPTGHGAGRVVVSADGKRIAAFFQGTLTVRDAENGNILKELKIPEGFSTAPGSDGLFLTASADGKFVATGGFSKERKGAVVVWDVEKGEVAFQTETAQPGPVAVALSPDGKVLATRGNVGFLQPGMVAPRAGREVVVWDVAAKKELFKAAPATPGDYLPHAMQFSPDGSVLAFSFADGAINLWDAKTGKQLRVLLGRLMQGYRMAFSPDSKTLAALAQSGWVDRWTVADGKRLAATDLPFTVTMVGPRVAVAGIAFADNERALVWGHVGPCPAAWEVPSGKVVTQLPIHRNAVLSVAFPAGAGGKELLTCSAEGRYLRWGVATGKLLGPVPLKVSRFAGVLGGTVLSPDGSRSAVLGGSPAIFDHAELTETAIPCPKSGGFLFLPTVDLKRACIVTWSSNGSVPGRCEVWDLVAWKKVSEVELPGLSGFSVPAALGPSGERLVTVSLAARGPGGKPILTITGWDLKAGKKLGEMTEELSAFGTLQPTVADDTFAVLRSAHGRLRVLNYVTGKIESQIEPDGSGSVTVYGTVAFSADGKLCAAALPPVQGQWTHGVRVYEWPSGKPLHTFTGHSGTINTICFSPDGKALATGSQDSTVVLWDLTAEK